jgi:hypothetical protein
VPALAPCRRNGDCDDPAASTALVLKAVVLNGRVGVRTPLSAPNDQVNSEVCGPLQARL